MGANVHRGKGNNPDRQLRSQSYSSVGNDVGRHRQLGGWLRSSHPLKRNSSLVESACAEDLTGLKLITEAADAHIYMGMVEERSVSR